MHHPQDTLEVKGKLPQWSALLEQDGWKPEVLSLGSLMRQAIQASGRWEAWLEVEAKRGSMVCIPVLAQVDFNNWRMPGQEVPFLKGFLNGPIPFLERESVLFGLLIGLGLLLATSLLRCLLDRRVRAGRLSPRGSLRLRALLLVGFFVVWEMVLQSVPPSPYEMFVPEPRLFWKANPRYVDMLQMDSLNRPRQEPEPDQEFQLGLFDRDHLGPKARDAYRVLFIGDSQLVNCDNIPGPRSTYPKLLEHELTSGSWQTPDGRRVEVINGGIPGYSSWQGVLVLRSDLLDLQPDLVVAAFGYHDSNPSLAGDREILTDAAWIHTLRTWMYRSRVCVLLRTLVLRRQAALNERSDPRDWVPRVSLNSFEQNLRDMVALGQRRSFRAAFLTEPCFGPTVEGRVAPYQARTRQLAAQLGVAKIDAAAAFHKLSLQDRARLFQDSIHLSRVGHETAAAVVRNRLVELGLVRQVTGTAGLGREPSVPQVSGGDPADPAGNPAGEGASGRGLSAPVSAAGS